MNEVDAIRLKMVTGPRTLKRIIECCKDWRGVIVRKIHTTARPYKVRVYQEPLSNKLIDFVLSEGALGNEISALWSRQSGKTETVALTVLALGTFYLLFLNLPFKCGLFAPVESMITHVTRNRLRTRFKRLKPWLEKVGLKQTAGTGLTSSLFVLENVNTEYEFYIRSLSVGDRAEIIGETFALMVIEQSELVNASKLKNDVFPMGAEQGGVRILTGTTSPYFRNEYFREAIQKYNEDSSKNKSTSDYLSMVKAEEAAKYSVAYRRYVKRERDRLGKNSIEYKTQYDLEWVGIKLKFIQWDDLVNLEKDYTWSKDRLRFFAIDVARAGDSTVVTIIEVDGTEIHILGWLEMEGVDFEKQLPRIVEFLEKYRPLRYGLIDIVGIGRPIYDMLRKKLCDEVDKNGRIIYRPWARLDSYYGSPKRNHDVYQAFDREVQHGRLFYPKETEYHREKNTFIEQMMDVERKYTGYMLKLEAPKGKHDDYVVSVALAVYGFKERSFKTGVTHI